MRPLLITLIFLATLSTSCSNENKTLFKVLPASKTGIYFNNKITETDSFNIITSEYIFNGGGVASGDFNNDGLPDIFFSGNQVPNKLYLNKDNLKFEDISEKAGIQAQNSWNTGVAVVDINSDGWLDIYVCSAMLPTDNEKKNKLFVNQGTDNSGVPVFKEEAEAYGIAGKHNSMNATFFDYDKDGLLDLYVLNNVDIHVLPAHYREKIIDGSSLSNDKLYRNNGNGTFTDVTLKAGIVYEGYGLGLAISDINYDGWPDIYVSNDYLTNDLLYINNQDGTFSNNISDFIKHQSKFSMGSDIADYDNDGLVDIITLDMLGETNERLKTTIPNNKYTGYILNEKFGYDYQYMRNMLQKGNGADLPFSEVGLMAGVAKTDWSWSPLFADMDNDGYKDLLITNGFPRDITDLDFGEFKFNVSRYLTPVQILDSIPTIKIPNYTYKNIGENKFNDVGRNWGLDIPSFSNGAVFSDLDLDGDLDYIVNNINDEAFLFENKSDKIPNPNNYLSINLKGPKENPLGIGSKLALWYGNGKMQIKEQYLSRGYMSSVDPTLVFGIGNEVDIDSLEIIWPDGKHQTVRTPKSNNSITLKHLDAKVIDKSKSHFPFKPAKNTATLLYDVTDEITNGFIHKELDIVDYNVQRILPHKLTQNGPSLAKGDINGDGLEDFIVGSSSGYSPTIFFQSGTGSFTQKKLFSLEEDKKYEEESLVLFDLENDGDLDLYLVSGSNEFQPNSIYYKDRLLINDGSGNFNIAQNYIPEITSSGSIAIANDFDSDGFTDIFIGGRTPFGKYPMADQSFLLKNDKGILKDVTEEIAPELKHIGMVTDAIWEDVNGDTTLDLILVGELMPVTIFINENSKFRKLEQTGLEQYKGWWESIAAGDFDNDGDVDFVIGNLGENNFYQPSQKNPITVIAKDFDKNGTIDPVMFAHFRPTYKDTNTKAFPVNFWGDLYGQSPLFRSKFNSYKTYSRATIDSLFKKEELQETTKLLGNHDQSVVVENLGNNNFNIVPLPWQAQIAPINKTLVRDFNKDGNQDILLIGNDFGNEIFIGRLDAFNGSLMLGDGTGNFSAVTTLDSGFFVSEDAKDMIAINNEQGDEYVIVSQNRGPLKVFKYRQRALSNPLKNNKN